MTNKKIAFLVYDYTCVGGVERVTSSLISLFKERGIKTDLLLSIFNNNQTPKFEIYKVIETQILKPTESFTFEDNLRMSLKDNQIDILIYQGDNMTYSLKIQSVLKKSDCKGILQYHGSPYAYLKKRVHLSDVKQNPIFLFKKIWNIVQFPFKKHKLKQVLKGTNVFVCVSEGAINEIKGLYPKIYFSKNRLKVIHNLLTFDLIDYKRVSFKLKKNILIYVSRLERKHKNSMMVMKVWELLYSKFPNWELHILGEGKLRNAMDIFVKSKKLERCIFHGLVLDVGSHFKKSKIVLLTSDCEGLPTVLLEAVAHSNAIATTKSDGGVVDIVPTYEHGIKVKMNDAVKMAEELNNLILDEDTLERNIIKSQENLKKEFNKEIILNEWIFTLNEL